MGVWGVRSVHKIKIRHERCLIPARAPLLPRALATTWRQLGRGANTNGPHPTPYNPHPPCPTPFLFYFTTGASERRATWARSLNHTHKSSDAFWIVTISCLWFCFLFSCVFFFSVLLCWLFSAFAFCVVLYISACQCISKFAHTHTHTHISNNAPGFQLYSENAVNWV